MFEVETDEPENVKAIICKDAKRFRTYFRRDNGTWLWVCCAPHCGATGDEHALPPGYKKQGHGWVFSLAQLEEEMGTAQDPDLAPHRATPPYQGPA